MLQWIYEWYQTIRIMMNRKLYRELREPIDTAQIVRDMRNEDNRIDIYYANVHMPECEDQHCGGCIPIHPDDLKDMNK